MNPGRVDLSWHRAVIALALAMAFGCAARPVTQIVVRIDSDMAIPAELEQVRVVVRRPGVAAPVLDRTFDLRGSDANGLPGEVGVVARNPDDRGDVIAEVTAITPNVMHMFTQTVTGAFQPRRTVVMNVFLAARCRTNDRNCPVGSACGQCGCEPRTQTALRELVQDASGPPRLDATAGDGAVACDPVHPLNRPSGLTNTQLCSGDAGTNVRVFVVRRLHFGWPPDIAWRNFGFDFDGVCTDPAQGAAARIPCAPLGGTRPVEDGERGIDNAFAVRLGQAIAASGRLTERDLNMNIERGRASLAMRIVDYGGSDDGEVTVDLLPVTSGHRPGAPMAPPTWDGNDEWYVDRAIAYQPGTLMPNVRVTSAFIYNGTLVARLPSRTPIVLLANGRDYVRFTLSGALLQGPIGGGGRRLGPLDLAGYLPIADLRSDLSSLGLCPGSIEYMVVSGFLDGAADLFVEGDQVRVAPGVMCNALSVGMNTEWTEITLNDLVDPGTGIPINSCNADAGMDAGFDASIPEGGADVRTDVRSDARTDAGADVLPPRG